MSSVVFNRTRLPRNKCEEYCSIATIENGELLQSKLEKFAIFKYTKEDEQVAITLNQNIQTCGKILYQTGIPDVYVVLIEESEEFLDNEKLKFTEYEESTIYEADLKGKEIKRATLNEVCRT